MPIINFQLEKQQHNNWCWAAVAVSVDRYFDPKSAWCQCRMASRMAKAAKLRVTQCGTCRRAKRVPHSCNQPWYLDEALKFVDRLKGKPKPGALSFAGIRKSIKAGRPVCARILWGVGGGAHFVVISGCVESASGERWVDVQDPLTGNATWLYDEFLFNYQYFQGRWDETYPV